MIPRRDCSCDRDRRVLELAPTGRSCTTSMPWRRSMSAGPIPDSINSCGELTVPARDDLRPIVSGLFFASCGCNACRPAPLD